MLACPPQRHHLCAAVHGGSRGRGGVPEMEEQRRQPASEPLAEPEAQVGHQQRKRGSQRGGHMTHAFGVECTPAATSLTMHNALQLPPIFSPSSIIQHALPATSCKIWFLNPSNYPLAFANQAVWRRGMLDQSAGHCRLQSTMLLSGVVSAACTARCAAARPKPRAACHLAAQRPSLKPRQLCLTKSAADEALGLADADPEVRPPPRLCRRSPLAFRALCPYSLPPINCNCRMHGEQLLWGSSSQTQVGTSCCWMV